jgi:hypothetical protein
MRLASVDAVIDALGGTHELARALSGRGRKVLPQSVSNWRTTGRMPARHYLVMIEALHAHGADASSQLWGITPPPPSSRVRPSRSRAGANA